MMDPQPIAPTACLRAHEEAETVGREADKLVVLVDHRRGAAVGVVRVCIIRSLHRTSVSAHVGGCGRNVELQVCTKECVDARNG